MASHVFKVYQLEKRDTLENKCAFHDENGLRVILGHGSYAILRRDIS